MLHALLQQRRNAYRAIGNRKLGMQMQVDEWFSHNPSANRVSADLLAALWRAVSWPARTLHKWAEMSVSVPRATPPIVRDS
jgi:hypothetical protein